jgi:hypothetical protein
MSMTETKRNLPKPSRFGFALSANLPRPKPAKPLPKGRGDKVSPLARAAACSVPADRGIGSAALALRSPNRSASRCLIGGSTNDRP